MGSAILHFGATIQCPHGGRVMMSPQSPASVSRQRAVTMQDVFTVVGCPFQVATPAGPKPQPCVCVQWQMPALAVKAARKQVLLQSSTGLCFSAEGIPQGKAVILQVQQLARGR
jgi:hypothetical protein